jgi:hypothetical protein
MHTEREIKVGIGFATGRKTFKKVLKTYIYNWKESGLVENQKVSLNVLVAYDLNYNKTKLADYRNVQTDLLDFIDSSEFIGKNTIQKEIDAITQNNILSKQEAQMLFGDGYAGKRNAVLYKAIKNQMHYLIFLDDDEYPLAVTNTKNLAVWSGQHVLDTHLKYIDRADITHGKHCGYISPIPYVEFNETMSEKDFRLFIEAISNDIINWDKIKTVMQNGGVTYADTKVLTNNEAIEVKETNNIKFISGANLCINLAHPKRVFPFYNPPGARGEDTFLSTCLADRKVLRVPCYTFHDGFSTYNHLLEGVLPIKLNFIQAESEQIINRFYNACLGWIRYKPLLLYITQRDAYSRKIDEIQKNLCITLPIICNYFKQPKFMNILEELENYHQKVETHYSEFEETKRIWAKLMSQMDLMQNNID